MTACSCKLRCGHVVPHLFDGYSSMVILRWLFFDGYSLSCRVVSSLQPVAMRGRRPKRRLSACSGSCPGLSFNKMALITSDCGTMRSLRIK